MIGCVYVYTYICIIMYTYVYVSVWNYIDQLLSLLAGEEHYDDNVLSFVFYRIPIDFAEFWMRATQRYIPPWSNGPKMTRSTIHQALNNSATTASSARTSWWKHWAFSGTTGHHGSHSLGSFFKWHFPVAFGHLGPWRFSEIIDFPMKKSDFP